MLYQEHRDWVRAVAWSPNGLYLASGGDDLTVRVWDATTGITLVVYHEHWDHIQTVAWSPDGRYLVSGGADQLFWVWDAQTG